jgi:sirohydrochlorin ferrochelatase
MINSCAYLLVVHGSRNSNYQKSLTTLANLVRNNLQNQNLLVKLDTAYLELTEQSLAEKIVVFAQDCVINNYQTLKILPLFLLAGSHVKQDIPQELSQAQQILQQQNIDIKIQLLAHLGKEKRLVKLLEQKYQEQLTKERILIAHGTTLEAGNQECEQLALSLEAKLAYWSIPPSFSTILTNLADRVPSITILPYFLFTGKISEAISESIKQLQEQYPETKFSFIEPFGATAELASIITEILLGQT